VGEQEDEGTRRCRVEQHTGRQRASSAPPTIGQYGAKIALRSLSQLWMDSFSTMIETSSYANPFESEFA
jgi:hypothetical protein